MGRIARLKPTVFNKVLIFDDFNRMDGPIGTAVTGQAWTTFGRTQYIDNNRVASTGGITFQAGSIINANIKNCIVSMLISTATSYYNGCYLWIRRKDSNNYVVAQASPEFSNCWSLINTINGVRTVIFQSSKALQSKDNVKVIIAEEYIELIINNISYYSNNYAGLFNDGTYFGFGNSRTTFKIDDFLLEGI